jgi:hypothetical protein
VLSFGVLHRWQKAELLSGYALTRDENDGSGRVAGEAGGFQLLGAELGHLEVDGEESSVRADEVVGLFIDDDDAVLGSVLAEIGASVPVANN